MSYPVAHPSRWLAAVLFLAASLAAALGQSVDAPAPPPDWSGQWRTYWRGGQALMTLWQDGAQVRGAYEPEGGRIQALAQGNQLSGVWTQAGATGDLLFVRAPDGESFVGRFGNGEYWNGERVGDAGPSSAAFFGASTPQDTLRAVAVAANAAAEGEGAASLAFGRLLTYAGPETDARDRNRRRQLFLRLLDMSTFRIFDAPETGDGGRARFEIGPAGSDWTFSVDFAQDALGAWRIEVPPLATLRVLERAALESLELGSFDAFVNARRDSPRQAMRDFLTGVRAWETGGAERALATLDLSATPEQLRPTEGPLAADYLRQIIDRLGYVIWQEIPDDGAQRQPYLVYEHREGDIAIARHEEAGAPARWRFTAESLAAAPAIYAAMRDLPLAPGVTPPEPLTRYFDAREALEARAPWLLARPFLLETWQWLALAATVVAAAVLGRLAPRGVFALVSTGERLAGARAETRAATAAAFGWPARLLTAGLVVALVGRELGLRSDVAGLFGGAGAGLLIVGATFFLYHLVTAVSVWLRARADATQTRVDDIAVAVATGLARIGVVLLGVLAGAKVLGLPYEGVLAGIGVGSLALAFAARDSVANMLGAAILLVDRPFKTGDLIEACGQIGVVEEVGLRSTQLRTLDDAVLVVPNAKLADDVVNNWGRLRSRRIVLTVPVASDTKRATLDRFVERLRALFAAQPGASSRPAYIGLQGVGEGVIEIGVTGWLATPHFGDFVTAKDRLVSDIVGLAEEFGVDLAPRVEAGEDGAARADGGPEAMWGLSAATGAQQAHAPTG